MRQGCKAWVLAIVTVFACAWDAAAKAPSRSKESVHNRQVMLRHSYIRSLGHGDWHALRRAHWERGTGYVDLVGDPGSGFGFYQLPIRYRIGAWRYHLLNRRPPWQNPVLFAIAADAARYNYWTPVADQGYRYGVFDPNEGVGTPFFGGYYGSTRDDDEPPPFPFGRPYPH
jgi:hypothetical protein